ncbi:uncharacterized protein Z518_03875 [Rhinocladiella mackenziei CBS 650.93]|uniref:Rhinocladiella mackenziei CBS 650.93 unplaced genomic scaffold supercont1.3, whole genome shotgun sequence n=1 Tax=Rhinocladiella mackenziei CBS 650.93 TaxID=1442369 RepID=A0A0D2FUY4_9EURO|nr:uncharacterized protein Z518_03875 [Rhinocladiella mackenziei CBS 650.93]KIX05902.1 hypothetical protein Z518_03875 [Rhinocladiella mackenziei CBS 650.93]
MAAITQTIAIVDRSNKIISTSKQLKNVFKEAKMAYMERKAEIMAERRAREEKDLRKAMKVVTLAEETRSETSPRSKRRHSHKKEHEYEHDRQRSLADGHHHSESGRRKALPHRDSSPSVSKSRVEARTNHAGLAQFNEELYGTHRSAPTSPVAPHGANELVRRTTDLPLEAHRSHRRPPVRSHSTSDMDGHIDMDLAYGEFHPESLMLDPKVEHRLQKQEMSSLVTKCKMLLDEANCAQHSVRAIIAHLQQNPDAMAAVALTLAEISNLASKMAPGALAALKTGAPTVFAMLAAPEFLIAVGAGIGLTVVMFGGYKIIKKIKASVGDKPDDGMDEMLDVNGLDRIEHWRRGIPDAETASVATSVEGEYITPIAAASMGHLPLPKDRSESRHNERRHEEKKKKKKKQQQHSRKVDDDPDRTMVGSERSSKSKRSSKSDKREKALVKSKKPSPLRRMFSSKDSESSSRR